MYKFVFFILLTITLIGCILPQASCGNTLCEVGEDNPALPTYCPTDCGKPPVVCGNNICEDTENAISCPSDCVPDENQGLHHGCRNAQCVKIPGPGVNACYFDEECIPIEFQPFEVTLPNTCYDTDGNYTPEVQSKVPGLVVYIDKGNTRVEIDTCLDSNTLHEKTCLDNSVVSIPVSCFITCDEVKGRCA